MIRRNAIPCHIVCRTYLLSQAEDLEALKVGQVLPPVGTLGLLSVVALSPLGVDLVVRPELLDGTSTGGTGELGDGEVGEGSVGEGKDVTGDDLLLLAGGTVNQDLSRESCQYNPLFRLPPNPYNLQSSNPI